MSHDLSAEFPDVKGFSYRNIRFIRQWYIFWQQGAAKIENENWQQLVAILFQVPWGHHQIILNKIKNIDEAIYYVQNTMRNGISRSVLVHQIESNLYEREGKAITNFENTLPPLQSDLANKYNFKISKQEKIMFEKWNQEDPISQWEKTKIKRIEEFISFDSEI